MWKAERLVRAKSDEAWGYSGGAAVRIKKRAQPVDDSIKSWELSQHSTDQLELITSRYNSRRTGAALPFGVISHRFDPRPLLPVCPAQRTSWAKPVRSEKCQFRTHASQQTRSYSITSSAQACAGSFGQPRFPKTLNQQLRV